MKEEVRDRIIRGLFIVALVALACYALLSPPRAVAMTTTRKDIVSILVYPDHKYVIVKPKGKPSLSIFDDETICCDDVRYCLDVKGAAPDYVTLSSQKGSVFPDTMEIHLHSLAQIHSPALAN